LIFDILVEALKRVATGVVEPVAPSRLWCPGFCAEWQNQGSAVRPESSIQRVFGKKSSGEAAALAVTLLAMVALRWWP